MNAYERVMNRLEGKPVDKVPNLNILMAFAARYAGISFDKFCQDYRYLVEANVKCCEDFGIDMLNTMSDPFRETFDLGASIEFPYDSLPLVKEPFIKEPSDIKKLKPFSPWDSTRMLDRIRAIEAYKKDFKGVFPILGWVEGCLAEAVDLRGLNNLMLDLFDNPSLVTEIMDICLEIEISCAKAQIEAGADFIGVGDSAASLVNPRMYTTLVLPYEQRLISSIHENGARAKLHICGNVTHILDEVWKTGADIIDIDWMVNWKRACEIIGPHACVNGNYDPVSVVLQGTPDTIKQAVWECLSMDDGRICSSAGCEIPVDTPPRNLSACHEALLEYKT